jgi:hypothetical protein
VFPAAEAIARRDLPADCQGESLGDIAVANPPGTVLLAPPGGVITLRPGDVGVAGVVDAPFDQLVLSAAWQETWPLRMCGQDRTLHIVFAPRKDGGLGYFHITATWRAGASGLAARPPSAN